MDSNISNTRASLTDGALGNIPVSTPDGRLAAIVWLTTDHKHIVDWRGTEYSDDPAMIEKVKAVKKILSGQHENDDGRPDEPCTLMVFVKLEFADDTATLCKYTGQHTKGVRSDDISRIVNMVKDAYVSAGYNVISVAPVDENQYDAFIANSAPNMKSYQVEWDSRTDMSCVTRLQPVTGSADELINTAKNILRSGQKNPKLAAMIDMYELSSNKQLFQRNFEIATGESFTDTLRRHINSTVTSDD